ncbi:hypothetical protein [Paenibacillus herberti]|uniref:Uncharacterized protein n=1 Tax=Paenibacillus herberti TaxID=1619309 RepID=A0A229P3M8_9BACL|nr:hypothetical protein [Paenibacillus herberti]OXM16853.1 hypothetical protein CGZ75_09450 [Paenibacillus herberti]
MMVCPEDYAVMNHAEHNGVTMGKCPICGIVVIEDEEGRLTSDEGLYPSSEEGRELKLHDLPYGSSAPSNEADVTASVGQGYQCYGMPQQLPQTAAMQPYGYVPEKYSNNTEDQEQEELAYATAPGYGAKAPSVEGDGAQYRANPYFVF